MEYDNDQNTWRRPSSLKLEQTACHTTPRRSTTIAVVVLGLAVLSCLLGYCVLSESLPYESKTLRLVIIYWIDYKGKLKKRCATIRSAQSRTDGEPSNVPQLSTLENKFLNIVGEDFGLGLPGIRVNPFEDSNIHLFRHGARTPVNSYKSDPFKNYQWPDGLESLTNAGKLQLYELGKKYRNYYANFIPEEYYEKDIYIKSSDKSRCLMSAYTFLAGLYPPSERQLWHPEIPWQPIPVHSLPKHLDDIVAQTKPCKVWKSMYQELLDEKNADPKFAELFDYLSKHTNQSMRSVLDVDFLYSTLLAQQDAGLKLPEWTKNVFPNKMRTPFMLSLALLSYNKTLQRLKVGPILAEIKTNLQETVNHANSDRSLFLYSGHDVNVVALWRALGYEELLEPDYGASLVLELHEEVEQDSFFVKLFYRNNTKVEIPMELNMPFCEDPCTYKRFIQHIESLIPADWEAECQN